MISTNPFIYGPPVAPANFVGRTREVREISARIVTGQSTAIFGERKIGKTSLLRFIASDRSRREEIGRQHEHFIISELDGQSLGARVSIWDFWTEALRPLQQETDTASETYKRFIQDRSDYSILALERVFKKLDGDNIRLVLLIDEFDYLIHHSNLGTAEFLGGLRSLASRSRSLVIITASMLPLSEYEREIRGHSGGSPFFNIFTDIHLGRFSPQETRLLLHQALSKTHIEFGDSDHLFVRYLSGDHPYLVQVAAGSLFEIKEEQAPPHIYKSATENFAERTRSHYSDHWGYIDVDTQKILTLLVTCDQVARNEGQTIDLAAHMSELAQSRFIENQDLVLPIENDSGTPPILVRFGERELQLRDTGFYLWIIDEITGKLTRDPISLGAWLNELISAKIILAHETNWISHIFQRVSATISISPGSLVERGMDDMVSINRIAILWAELAPQNHDEKEFIRIIHAITNWLCDTFGFAHEFTRNAAARMGDLYAFLIDVSSLSRGSRIPSRLPLVFTRHGQFLQKDIHDLLNLLAENTLPSERIVLLTFPVKQSREDKLQILESIRRAYAYDVIHLGLEDLRRVLVAENRNRALRRLILDRVDLNSVSPFVINGPVTSSVFFGREKELREIVEHIVSGSFAIIGGRRIGKSSLLNRLYQSQLPAVGFYTLYHDCSSAPDYETFMATPIHLWLSDRPPNAPKTFGELIKSSMFDKPLAVLLDEADKLVQPDRSSRQARWPLFNALRALSNNSSVRFIFGGERTLRDALRDPTSPLFNFANEILLRPLDFGAVAELVTQPMRQLEIEILDDKEIVKQIWDFTSGHPNVIQRLCRRLIEWLNANNTRSITLDSVRIVIEDPGFQRDDFLGTYWEAADVLEKIISLLMAGNTNISTLGTVRRALSERCGLQPKTRDIDNALQRLVDLRSILKRTPLGYVFAVEAFPRVIKDTITLQDMLEVFIEEYKEKGE